MCYEDTFYLLFPYDILSLRKLITWYKALIENSDESTEFKKVMKPTKCLKWVHYIIVNIKNSENSEQWNQNTQIKFIDCRDEREQISPCGPFY